MKRNKKFALVALLLLAVCAVTPLLSACNETGGTLTGGGADTLVIYNWEDYIDVALLDEFEAYYREVTGRNLSITYSTFDTNETMLTQVMRGETAVDVVCPSEYAIERLMRADLLADQTELVAEYSEKYPDAFSNLGNVNQTVLEKIGETFGEMEIGGEVRDMRDYMVPYMWGTLGLLYNTRVISEEELEKYGWGMLWNESNNPELENMILMKDSVRDSYAAVVFYMEEYGLLPDGVSETYGKPFKELTANELINCTDKALLDAAEKLLTEQRERISGYEVDFGKDDMINEIVYLDLAWSGDALWAVEESEYDEETDTYQLGYYVPEKSNIWYDGWAILESSDSKLAAMMFIDYMCSPEAGARNIGYIGYTSAVDQETMKYDYDAAQALLEVEYLWYANAEECSVYDYNGDMVFYYEWVEGEGYYLDLYGGEVEVTDENDLVALDLETDEEGYYLLPEGLKDSYPLDEEYIVCPDSISLFYYDEGRYPEITDNLGVMQDYGAANEDVVNMWQRAKAGGGVPSSLWWCLLAIVLFVGIVLGAYFLKEALKAKPKKIMASPSDTSAPDDTDGGKNGDIS